MPLLSMAVLLLVAYFAASAHSGRFDAEPDLSKALPGCVVADSAVSSTGAVSPAHAAFNDIGSAERYVCHDVAYPRNLGDWRLQGIDAMTIGHLPPPVMGHFWRL